MGKGRRRRNRKNVNNTAYVYVLNQVILPFRNWPHMPYLTGVLPLPGPVLNLSMPHQPLPYPQPHPLPHPFNPPLHYLPPLTFHPYPQPHPLPQPHPPAAPFQPAFALPTASHFAPHFPPPATPFQPSFALPTAPPTQQARLQLPTHRAATVEELRVSDSIENALNFNLICLYRKQ